MVSKCNNTVYANMGWFDSEDDKYHWLGGDPADPFSYVPKDDDEGCGCFIFTVLLLFFGILLMIAFK